MIDAIGAKIGDTVTIPIDFSGVLGEQGIQNLLALMLLEIETGYINYDTNEIGFDGQSMYLDDLI